MAIEERHRATLYRKLTQVVGDEEAVAAMISSLTAVEADQVATKDFVRAEIATAKVQIIMWMVATQFATIGALVTLLK